MVELPEQIRRQSEAIKQHFTPENPSNGSENADPNEVIQGEDVQLNADSVPPVQGATGEQPEDPNSETFQQRYRTLQGTYNADLQRARARDAEQAGRIQQLEQLLAAIPATPQPNAGIAPDVDETPRYVSDKERDEYGESIEVMRKVSREEVGPVMGRLTQMETQLGQIISSLNQNIVPQVQQVAQRQVQTAQDAFWSELSNSTPNWQAINNDKDFHDWLLEVDPLTGSTRQAHLEQAQNSLDARRVAAFFRTFSDVTGKYKANAPAQSTRSAQTSELEKQVAPGRSRSTSAPTGQTTQKYTRADIQKFFDDVSHGKYKGRETERNRIERDIFSAQAEGRIVA